MRDREKVEAALLQAQKKRAEYVASRTWINWLYWDNKMGRLKDELAAIVAAEKEAGK